MYSIQEVCNKTGLTAHTLRYYEKEGLLTSVARSAGGFRQYSDEDMEWLGLICCLKNTGMSIQEIARFVQLTHEGDHTLSERVELLREHRERVLERMAEMQKHLDKVTWKLNFYSEKLKDYQTGKQEKKWNRWPRQQPESLPRGSGPRSWNPPDCMPAETDCRQAAAGQKRKAGPVACPPSYSWSYACAWLLPPIGQNRKTAAD